MPESSVTLPPVVDAPAQARDWVLARLGAWGVDGCDGTVALLVSELVTNVVQHAHTSLDISLAMRDDPATIEVAVQDHAALQTRTITRMLYGAPEEPLTEHGRGLVVVGTLADVWGVAATPTGKNVWFRLRSKP